MDAITGGQTVPITQTEMRTSIRKLLNEATAAFWTDDDLDTWIVEATLDISTKARCVEAETTVSFTPSTTAASVPQGAIGIEALLVNGGGLAKVRPRQFKHLHAGDAGPPTHYAHFAGQVYIHPVPDQSYTATILFWKRTRTFTDLPDEYYHLVQGFAVMQAKFKDEKYAQAAQLYSMYLRELQFQRVDLQEREPDTRATLRFADAVQEVGRGG